MTDGIRWLTTQRGGWYCGVTFARGVDPEELAVRLGAEPGSVLPPVTARQAAHMIDGRNCFRVARIGTCAGWSFAVEDGYHSRAWWAKPEMTRGGVEMIHLTPKPDDPPREFWYYENGATVCAMDIGSESRRRGNDPDVLVPALARAGLVSPTGGPLGGERHDDYVERLFGALEDHFKVSLPRDLVVDGALPAAVTATSEPRNLGD